MAARLTTDKRALVLYFSLAYGIGWILWAPLVLSKRGLGLLPLDLPIPALLPGGFAPLLAAYLTHRYCYGNWRAVDFRKGWPRAWLGILLAPLLFLAGEAVLPALFLTRTSAAALHWKCLWAILSPW